MRNSQYAPFPIHAPPTDSTNLIEASAGTGKTYTIVHIVIHLIEKKGIALKQILVGTFTNAATAELRQRIRSALLLRRSELNDPVIKTRIQAAIDNFDESSICTIHSFCTGLIKEFPSHFFQRSDLEIDTSEQIIEQLVTDYLRSRRARANPRFCQEVLNCAHEYVTFVTRYLPMHYRVFEPINSMPAPDEHQIEDSIAQLSLALETLQPQMHHVVDGISNLLHNKVLKANEYRIATMQKKQELLTEVFTNPCLHTLDSIIDILQFFSTPFLEKRRSKKHENTAITICKPVDRALTVAQHLQMQLSLALSHELYQCLHIVREQMRIQQVRNATVRYDDLLQCVAQALAGPHKKQLCDQLQQRYKAALIDEFQDTDAIQFFIFKTLFFTSPKHTLYLIGDPKQSIYQFRGADIYTYLAAREACSRKWQLATNYRSTPRMVAAVNCLFGSLQTPFHTNEITYAPVQSSKTVTQHRADAPALEVFFHPEKNNLTVDEVSAHAAEIIASKRNEIPQGIFAILVQTRTQGKNIQFQLLKRGIQASCTTDESLWQSTAVQCIRIILAALASPFAAARARSLAVLIATHQGQRYAAISPQHLRQYSDNLHRAHQMWKKQGVGAALLWICNTYHLLQATSNNVQTARFVTDMLHGIEFLASLEAQKNLSPPRLCKALEQRIASAEQKDLQELQRSSAENPDVEIVTIHKSKGLEYDYVFLPFLCLPKTHAKAYSVSYYNPQYKEIVVSIGDDRHSSARMLHEQQLDAEKVRLFYVAITRAKQGAWLWIFQNKNFKGSILSAVFQQPSVTAVIAQLHQLSAKNPELIQLHQIDTNSQHASKQGCPAPGDLAMDNPTLLQLTHPIQTQRIAKTSFTRLSQSAAEPPVAHEPLASVEDFIQHHTPSAVQEEKDATQLPPGAESGTLLHAALEKLVFSTDEVILQNQLTQLIETFAIQSRYQHDFSTLITATMSTVLAPASHTTCEVTVQDSFSVSTAFALGDIDTNNALREFDFVVPLRSSAQLSLLLSSYPQYAYISNQIDGSNFGAFLSGSIDVVVQKDQRWYIVDYKSNFLGPSPAHYNELAIRTAMSHGRYHLQYLLYTAAWIMFVRKRDPGFCYQRHFGGVYYLFLRGLPEPQSVYFDLPPQQLIEEIIALCR